MNTNNISREPVRLDSSIMFASAAVDFFGSNQMPENASVAGAFEHSALGKLLKDSLANAISDIDATFSAVSMEPSVGFQRLLLGFGVFLFL